MTDFILETYFVNGGIYNITKGTIPEDYEHRYDLKLSDIISSTENHIVPMPEDFKIFDTLPFSNKYQPKIYFIYSEYQNNKLIERRFLRHFGFAGGYRIYDYQTYLAKDTIQNSDVDQQYLDLQSLDLINEYMEKYEPDDENYNSEYDPKIILVTVDSHKIYSPKEFELSGTLVANYNIDEDDWDGILFGKFDEYIEKYYDELYILLNIEGVSTDIYGFHAN